MATILTRPVKSQNNLLDAYKHMFLRAECSVIIFSFMKNINF